MNYLTVAVIGLLVISVPLLYGMTDQEAGNPWPKQYRQGVLSQFNQLTVEQISRQSIVPMSGNLNIELDVHSALEQIKPWSDTKLLKTEYRPNSNIPVCQSITFVPEDQMPAGFSFQYPILYMCELNGDGLYQSNEIIIDLRQDGINGTESPLEVWWAGFMGTPAQAQTKSTQE